MYFLIFLIVIISVYIYSFKDDFSKEHLDKVVPFLSFIGVAITIFGILGSII